MELKLPAILKYMKSPSPQNLIPIDQISDKAILPTEMANYHANNEQKKSLTKKVKQGCQFSKCL